MAYSIISQSDVVRHPLFAKLKDKENGLNAILHSMGMDVDKGYETTNCRHRSELTNAVVHCERYCGEERTDDVWKSVKARI